MYRIPELSAPTVVSSRVSSSLLITFAAVYQNETAEIFAPLGVFNQNGKLLLWKSLLYLKF